MQYKVHCYERQYQFYESAHDDAASVIDFVYENRNRYPSIIVSLPDENGLFNAVLALSDGHVRWGEYELMRSARIREQELDRWPDIAAHPAYTRVALDQVDDYYRRNEEEILNSLWPEMPELCEVVSELARENNPGLFSMNGPAADGGEAQGIPAMRM